MVEQFSGEVLVEAAADVERPQRFQRELVLVIQHHLAQAGARRKRRAAPSGCAAPRRRASSLGFVEQRDELLAGALAQRRVDHERRLRPLRLDLVDAAVAAVPGVDGIDVVGALVVPVGDVEGAVRARSDSRSAGTTCRSPSGSRPILLHVNVDPLRSRRVPVQRVGKEIAGDVWLCDTAPG